MHTTRKYLTNVVTIYSELPFPTSRSEEFEFPYEIAGHPSIQGWERGNKTLFKNPKHPAGLHYLFGGCLRMFSVCRQTSLRISGMPTTNSECKLNLVSIPIWSYDVDKSLIISKNGLHDFPLVRISKFSHTVSWYWCGETCLYSFMTTSTKVNGCNLAKYNFFL